MRPFYAVSRSIPRTAAEVAEEARWLDAEPWTSRPLPGGRIGFVRTREGLWMHLEDGHLRPWHPGLAHVRLRDRSRDALARTLDLRPEERVLDCTFGLGHDAMVLADAGALVDAIDRSAGLLWYAYAGMRTYRPAAARRIRVACSDASEFLESCPPGRYAHVYLDPMFPVERTGPNATWGPIRSLMDVGTGAERPTPELVALARRAARRSVVLKLAPAEPPPAPGAVVRGSKRLQYAVWPGLQTDPGSPT
jgi:hypothetical protein